VVVVDLDVAVRPDEEDAAGLARSQQVPQEGEVGPSGHVEGETEASVRLPGDDDRGQRVRQAFELEGAQRAELMCAPSGRERPHQLRRQDLPSLGGVAEA
jgi:hypothetical protein